MSLTINNNKEQILTEGKIDFLSFDNVLYANKQFPYCAISQFAFTKKLYLQNEDIFIKQVQKSALYFNNINWLDFQLKHEEHNVFCSIEKTTTNDVYVEPILSQNEIGLETTIENQNTIEPIQSFDTTITEELIAKENNNDNSISLTSFALAASEENQIHEIDSKEDAIDGIDENTENIDLKIASSLEKQLSEFNKPIEENTELIIESEPYHTVDYFASQGIKVEIDPNAQDKLTKQVRKFTDWLKQMKTIQTTNTISDTELETEIQSIANDSNETKEIVTETMAEVLEKQGKYFKAISLYEKLSFLNPDKSTYFANKIQQLKNK
jgi:hypothetical protein